MAEPIATPVCTAALVVSGLTCTFFGLDFEALFWGFAGGVIAQTFIKHPDAAQQLSTIPKSFFEACVALWLTVLMMLRAAIPIAAGAVLAAVLTPVGMSLIMRSGIADGVAPLAVKIIAAVVLGIVAPSIPALLRRRAEAVAAAKGAQP